MPLAASLFRILLSLIMALTLSHGTVARSQGGTIAGWVALCAGEDVVAVPVDAQGEPVAPHLPCPDCILAGLSLLAAGPVTVAPSQRASALSRPVFSLFPVPFVALAPTARGPPVLV